MNQFLTKISDLFSKDILFASMLPALMFVAITGGVFFYLLGFDNAVAFYDGQSATAIVVISSLFLLLLIVMAYVMYSIRERLLSFWSGDSFLFGWVFGVIEEFYRNRFEKLSTEVDAYLAWCQKFKAFQNFVSDQPEEKRDPVDPVLAEQLVSAISNLSFIPSDRIKNQLLQRLEGIYARVALESLGEVTVALMKWQEEFEGVGQRMALKLDRYYGSRGTIKGSYLGNIIQSYNEYSFKRYRMEAEVFWPRLQKFFDDGHKAMIQDQRIILDFSIACASLSFLFSVSCLAGPYLHTDNPLWLMLIAVGLISTYLYYRMAAIAAMTLGHIVRSCYDLYRHKLIEELNLEFPTDTRKERQLWTNFSQFVTYGESVVITYGKKKKEEEEDEG